MLVLMPLIVINVVLYGGDSSYGPNQVALIIATAATVFVGLNLNYSWDEVLKGITNSIHSALPAILILLLIGGLAGTWLISGIVPTMIYYGLEIIHPSIFLVTACVVCAVVSLATGSSWTTVATVGVALLGIGAALGFNEGLIAGSIISGAYFGDKMSPLSDTTNLAPAMAGTDLFTHIRYMLWTTVPSFVITLIIFLVLGFFHQSEGNSEQIAAIMNALESNIHITPWLFIVPLIIIGLILKKVPAIPALLLAIFLGALAAIIFQPDILNAMGKRQTIKMEVEDGLQIQWEDGSFSSEVHATDGGTFGFTVLENKKEVSRGTMTIASYDKGQNKVVVEGLSADYSHRITASVSRSGFAENAYRSCTQAITSDAAVSTGNAIVDDLLETGGMAGMMNTIFLILCAMAFGGAMEVIGLLERITQAIISFVTTTGGLISATVATCLGFNATASDQYLAIVVPGKMFKEVYEEKGLAPQNLSRTLEDSATVTSVLIPWNTCGSTQSSVLGVATGDYFFYCFFNIISPIMTVLYGYLGVKIAKLKTQ